MEEAIRGVQEKLWEHLAMLGFDGTAVQKYLDGCGDSSRVSARTGITRMVWRSVPWTWSVQRRGKPGPRASS